MGCRGLGVGDRGARGAGSGGVPARRPPLPRRYRGKGLPSRGGDAAAGASGGLWRVVAIGGVARPCAPPRTKRRGYVRGGWGLVATTWVTWRAAISSRARAVRPWGVDGGTQHKYLIQLHVKQTESRILPHISYGPPDFRTPIVCGPTSSENVSKINEKYSRRCTRKDTRLRGGLFPLFQQKALLFRTTR